MKTSRHHALDTKRVYAFEEHYLCSSFLTKRRSLKTLLRVGKRIWKEECPDKPMPTIHFGRGVLQNGRWLSYCSGDNKSIVLSEPERNILTLIHELVHAMGYSLHNNAFLHKEIHLMQKYAQYDPNMLYFAACMSNIRILPPLTPSNK